MEAKSKAEDIFRSDEFLLDESFILQFKGKQPNWEPNELEIFKTVYAGYLEEEDRLEE